MRSILTSLIFFYVLRDQILCYKILGLFPFPGKSHFYFFEPVLKELAAKGHQLTVVSYFPQEEPIPNYRDISPPFDFSSPQAGIGIDEYDGSVLSVLKSAFHLAFMGRMTCENALSFGGVQELLKSSATFDVIIAEYFASDCLLPMMHKFKAPLIGISSSPMIPWIYERFGTPSNPSYIVNVFYSGNEGFDFFSRLLNTWLDLYLRSVYRFIMLPSDDALVKKYFGEDIPSVREIYMNSSLILMNSHFSYTQSKPLVPSVVEIGGIHVSESKQLPQNIEEWINESTHGVIYFSMGSVIRGHTFPDDKRDMFVRVFKRFPQRVLWKWENESLPGKPDNIMTQKWLPQFDILSHPNVKLFISHGGLLGTTEAVHCGVPVMFMPQFGDQFVNSRAVVEQGGGLIFDFRRNDEETLYNTLKTLLDPRFKHQAERLSARVRDRPLPPLETAIYWVEYIARHGGGQHMRTAAVGMPLYQYLLLDVIAFLSLVLISFLWIVYTLSKFILRKLFRSSPKVKTN